MNHNFVQLQQIPLLQYSISSQTLNNPGSVFYDPFCNSWTIVNLGDIWVTVNGILVKGHPVGHPDLTGSSIGAQGNYGEIYKGNIQVNSAQTTTGSGSTSFLLVFIQKVYNLA